MNNNREVNQAGEWVGTLPWRPLQHCHMGDVLPKKVLWQRGAPSSQSHCSYSVTRTGMWAMEYGVPSVGNVPTVCKGREQMHLLPLCIVLCTLQVATKAGCSWRGHADHVQHASLYRLYSRAYKRPHTYSSVEQIHLL